MANILLPKTVKISELLTSELKSISPSNYKKIGIENSNVVPIKDFLNTNFPFVRGSEQGSASYVEHSDYSFVRNSNVSKIDYTVDQENAIYIKPSAFSEEKEIINGDTSLKDLGYKARRGPSLQKRDLGRSIQKDMYNENYYQLIYPSDISDKGYIDKVTYLGASGKVWFLSEKDILFSSEGNVGKTFAVCDDSIRFTTNIHGMIITPLESTINLHNTTLIATFLSYMKHKGIIDKLSVGGQGGSFALQYWDVLRFPLFTESLKNLILELYHNPIDFDIFSFSEEVIGSLGIFEINFYRSRCKAMLEILISDLKNDSIKGKEYYEQYFHTSKN